MSVFGNCDFDIWGKRNNGPRSFVVGPENGDKEILFIGPHDECLTVYFECMEIAKDWVRNGLNDVEFTVTYRQDRIVVRHGSVNVVALDESWHDLVDSDPGKVKRHIAAAVLYAGVKRGRTKRVDSLPWL